MFKHVLLFSIEKSELSQSINEFSTVSNLSQFARLISSLKNQCNMSRLAKKITRWLDESKGNPKSFDYRFTRQESRRFLHNLMYMILAIEGDKDSRQVRMKLHIFAVAILSLRNAISLYSRFSIDEAQLNELDKECSNFFICCALFLEANPTVWTIGNVVPVHTRYLQAVWEGFAHKFHGGKRSQASGYLKICDKFDQHHSLAVSISSRVCLAHLVTRKGV